MSQKEVKWHFEGSVFFQPTKVHEYSEDSYTLGMIALSSQTKRFLKVAIHSFPA